jgi:pimeloyl-ACP methyl ester carboxylesterase
MTLYINPIGSPTAKTIVFLHGGGVSSWMWEPVLPHFKDYRVLLVDMPEHGKSIDEKPFSIEDTAARLSGIVRSHVKGGKAHFVGLSLGAQVIVELLGMAPDVVDRAVISGTLTRPLPGASMIGLMAAMYMPFRNAKWLIEANMKSLGIPAQYYDQFAADTRTLTTEAFTHITRENMRFSLPDLKNVNVSALVLVGQKEQKIMRDSAKDLIKVLPQAEGRIVPDVGHNWPLEAPELFAQVVRAWLEGQLLPTELLPL